VDNSSGVSYSGDRQKPVEVETLDEHTFGVINQLIEHSESVEAEFLRVTRQEIDISPGSPFQKWLKHSVTAILVVSRTHREGVFGQTAVRSDANKALMLKIEYTVEDMITLMSTARAEYPKYAKELKGLSEVYRVPMIKVGNPDAEIDKIGVIKAMFAEIHANFSTLKRQIRRGSTAS